MLLLKQVVIKVVPETGVLFKTNYKMLLNTKKSFKISQLSPLFQKFVNCREKVIKNCYHRFGNVYLLPISIMIRVSLMLFDTELKKINFEKVFFKVTKYRKCVSRNPSINILIQMLSNMSLTVVMPEYDCRSPMNRKELTKLSNVGVKCCCTVNK